MTKTKISKNEFFYEFTVKLCSSLDMRKTVYHCSSFLNDLIPCDIISLTLITDKPRTLKRLLHLKSNGELQDEQIITVRPEGWEYMQEHLKNNKVLPMYAPENRKYAETLTDYAENILESYDIVMPLVFEEQPLGFFALRGKSEFTEDQIKLISSVQEPIAIAIAASIRFENNRKKQLQFSPIDSIFNKIKLLNNIKTDKELAEKLDIIPSNISNHKVRKSIPYDKIILYCIKESIPPDFILMQEPFVLNKKNENGLYDAVMPYGIDQIDAQSVEELFQLPQGSLKLYIELCAFEFQIIPPPDKIPVGILKLFQNALFEQQLYGNIKSKKSIKANVPVATGVINGNGQVEMSEIFLYFCHKWTEKLCLSADVFAYYIQGDSMEPTFSHENVVLIDPKDKNPKSGGLYAVNIIGNIFIRRLTLSENGQLTMICDNKVYPADTISVNNVLGKVVWHARNL